MADPFENNPQLKEYFSTLPPMIQESILQSGISFRTREEMQKAVKNLTDPT